MATIDIKRGDTYSRSFQLFSDYPQNIAFNLTGYTLRSHVRDASAALISTCTCTITNATTGSFQVVCAAANTASWTVGQLFTDVEFTSPAGHVMSTDTDTINVIKDQTI